MSILKTIFRGVAALVVLSIVALAILAVFIFADFSTTPPTPKQEKNWINDVTQLNPIKVAKVIQPTSIEEVQKAITSSTGEISIGGGRYSQGGQIGKENSLHIDMRALNQVVHFAPEQQLITVQSGMRWRDLQEVIDRENLSIKIMQTYANFTVGGSLSVNVHGRYMGEGPIIRSVKSIKVVLADGLVVTASAKENTEIFYGVIGGYGGLGVIVEATLELVKNVKVARETQTMNIAEYSAYFQQNIKNDSRVIFHNADIYPPNYTQVNSVSWLVSDKPLSVQTRLIPKDTNYWWQPKVAEFVADYKFGKWLRQYLFDPVQYAFEVVQWRNFEASYDVKELEPSSRVNTTYALREYFVPVAHFDRFSTKMADIFTRYEVNVLNVSVRHAYADTGSLLAWAKEEVFAFVVYYRQGTSEHAQQQVQTWSRALVDAAIAEGGTYYLPYQLHATTAQFHSAYPNAEAFFALKHRLDPNNRFNNKLWAQHYTPKSE
ncbi:FAD-binding oxidoreductase [Pseudoalteromonas luteoviolacea]|uniref:FAD-binding oxidoreductase n=1 Tax=Pseudoalteromonas luteoviolacea TaxID=43657 RepID=UPI001F1B8E00|nr:FAD-binding oxidoreductase [Pseudoalteromonas luteoviolacea]MCF6439948.1 FAD-binding oxidoreductase [Pseudoalteromonas luteoviolacea]